MNKIIVMLSMFMVNSVVADEVMIMPLISVYDGDTVKTVITLPQPLNKLSIRLLGIDTPESTWRAKCEAELKLGKEAGKFLKDFLKDVKLLYVYDYKYGKYAGRIVANVYVIKNGTRYNLSELMTEKGYTKEYYGKSKPSWCD